ncbi:MAG: ABC transporter ATP-binding protein [Betaproteobacteria bacterium]|nr:ABC transporter ATP-binding protein [Betaproteobacteria bacterium]
MESRVAISFRGINKVFESPEGSVTAIENLSFDVAHKQFTALVGPSGCGKSTLLHIAAGLDTQYGGSFQSNEPDLAHRLACVFQAPRLLPWLTTAQNVEFVLKERGMSPDKRVVEVRRFIELVGLHGFEDRFPSQLSGGMQQRVSLARALAIDPAVLLMDEPFSALDELTARRLRIELLRLHAAQPRTVLFVTHNVTEAAYLSDRVMIMSSRPGRIITEVAIDIPYPRDYESVEVAALARKIVDHLKL